MTTVLYKSARTLDRTTLGLAQHRYSLGQMRAQRGSLALRRRRCMLLERKRDDGDACQNVGIWGYGDRRAIVVKKD
jgi:hypothetical protein